MSGFVLSRNDDLAYDMTWLGLLCWNIFRNPWEPAMRGRTVDWNLALIWAERDGSACSALTLLKVSAACCPSRGTWAFCKLLVYCCYGPMARMPNIAAFWRCRSRCKIKPLCSVAFPSSIKTLYKSGRVHRKCVPIVTSKRGGGTLPLHFWDYEI